MRVQRRQGFNPLLGLRDYSGYERAAEIERASMEQLGQNIGSAIKGYKANKKLDKKVGQLSDYLTKGIKNKTISPEFFDFVGIDASELKGKSTDVINKSISEGLNNYGKKESAELYSLLELKRLEKSLKKTPFEKKEETMSGIVQNPEYREILNKNPKYLKMDDATLTRTLVLQDEDIFPKNDSLDFILDQDDDDDLTVISID
tara:strand:+ start:562 stop:1170 length:609 start_codon:yes stop_codon:yes gene_type:complete